MSAGHTTATVLSQEGKDDSEKIPSPPVNSFIFSSSTREPSVSYPVIHDWPLPQSHFRAYLKCRFLGLCQPKSETLKPESRSLQLLSSSQPLLVNPHPLSTLPPFPHAPHSSGHHDDANRDWKGRTWQEWDPLALHCLCWPWVSPLLSFIFTCDISHGSSGPRWN